MPTRSASEVGRRRLAPGRLARHSAVALCAVAVLAACGGGGGDRGAAVSHVRQLVVGADAGVALDSARLLRSETRVMSQSGVRSMRVPVYWREVEPARNVTRWASLDEIVGSAATARLDLVPVVLSAPAWAARHPAAANSPPAGTASYAAFLRTLVHRYGPRGSFWSAHPDLPYRPIRAWQIWNEPNHLLYWSDQPFAASYVRLARSARSAIKAADPRAIVVMAAFADRSWDLVRQVYRAGGRGVFDVVAIHPYTFEPANVLRIVRLVRGVLRQQDDAARPIWATEITWSSGRGRVATPLDFETTERDQAARLTRAFMLLAAQSHALGLDRIYWESWITRDRNRLNTFDFSGLREARPDGSVRPKPAFFAFRRFALRCASGHC